MEDQQPGSGDLTAEPSEPPKTPVGKAARAAKTQAAEQRPDDVGEQPETSAVDDEVAESTDGATRSHAQSVDDDAAPDHEPDEAAEPVEDEAVDVPEDDEADEAHDEDDEADEAHDEDDEVDKTEVMFEPHRPAGRRMMVAVAAAAMLFVGSSAFAGAMVQPYLSERALVETKLDVAETAVAAITTLWTYTPDDMATLADRASRYLGGDFAEEYRRYIDAIVEPNKAAQVTNTTQVVGAAVESVSPPDAPSEATAIVYTNSVATSPVSKNIPSLRYLSYRLTMERDGSRWLVSRMSTVTSFDLTPQL